MPQVFVRWHRGEVLLAWFWPGGSIWVQPGGGVPVEVTSAEFAAAVELSWARLVVRPGTAGLWMVTPAGPAYFELVR